MNLSQYDTTHNASKGAFLHLCSPTGQLLYHIEKDDEGNEIAKHPIGVTCLGADSKEFLKCQHKLQDHRTDNVRVKRGGKIEGLSAEQTEEDALAQLSFAITEFHYIAWSDFPNSPVQMREATKENKLTFLEKFRWARDQVDEFVYDRTNFLGE